MENESKKPSLKDRVLSHKDEIVTAAAVIGIPVAAAVIVNIAIRRQITTEGQRIVEIINTQGKFVTDEVDGVKYVIHKFTE